MKNLIKILTIILISQSVSCQVTTTLPYKTLDHPNGAYLKDIDNEFPFWVDTWEGSVNNKKYTFTLIEFTQQKIDFADGRYIYRDKIVCKLKVIDLLNNSIIHDESSFSEYDDFIINGNAVINSKFYFRLFDKENHCDNSAIFILEKTTNNPNQITYKDFSYDEYEYWDCPYTTQEDIPMFLPKVDLVLTRQ